MIFFTPFDSFRIKRLNCKWKHVSGVTEIKNIVNDYEVYNDRMISGDDNGVEIDRLTQMHPQ